MKKRRGKTAHQQTKDFMRSDQRHPNRGKFVKLPDGSKVSAWDFVMKSSDQIQHHCSTRRWYLEWLESNPNKADYNEFTVPISSKLFWRLADDLTGYDGGDHDLFFNQYPEWLTRETAEAERRETVREYRAKGYHPDQIARWRSNTLIAVSELFGIQLVAMAPTSEWINGKIANLRVKLAFENADDMAKFNRIVEDHA